MVCLLRLADQPYVNVAVRTKKESPFSEANAATAQRARVVEGITLVIFMQSGNIDQSHCARTFASVRYCIGYKHDRFEKRDTQPFWFNGAKWIEHLCGTGVGHDRRRAWISGFW